MRVNKNVPQKERRRFSLDHFGGVDFGSSPLLCDPHRSPDAVNFIGDHGINRKRNGWEQVVETVDGKIHCIHQVNDDTIVVIGSTHRAILKKVDGYWKKESEVAAACPNRVTPVSFNNKVFFIGAGSLHWDPDKNELKEFTEKDYYIPTTTIDIDPNDEPDIRSTLDMPNLLTSLRKNTLVGIKTDDAVVTYRLDSFINMNMVEDYNSKFEFENNNFVVEINRFKRVTNGFEAASEKILGFARTVNSITVVHENVKYTGWGSIGYTMNGNAGTGMADQPFTIFSNFIDIQINAYLRDNAANITVQFPAADRYIPAHGDSSYVPKLINPYNGSIGASFGIDGMNDRLFVAGHPDHPNVIFFSDIDNPTYFPDQYTISVGTPNSKIIGLLRLSDDVMAVFKELSQSDACLYFIKGSYRNIYDEAGNIKKVLPVFSVTAASLNEATVNSHTCFNLNGDSIFLSNRGIYGIEPEQNIAADIRVARDRSYVINQKLASSDLSEAVGIVHGSKCYFSDGENCYVADSAYRYVPNGALSYNYEWWYWNNVPAISFGIVDGELWFGTKEGRICRFTDLYKDCVFDISKDGDIGVDKSNTTGALVCNDTWLEYLKTRGNRVRLITEGLMGRVASTTVDEEDSTLLHIVDPSYEDDIYDGQFVYIHYEGASNDVRSEVYYITNCDRGERTMSLEKDGQIVSFEKGITVNAYMDLSERDLYVIKTVDESKLAYIGISPDGGPLFVSGYHRPGKIPSNLILKQYIESNVSASWTTPPLDLGNDSISKCLYTMTVTAETGKNAKFKFGYDTRMGRMERASQGLGAFSFDNIDFRDLSFETGFQNSFTVRARERNFNFIRFNIKSDEDAPCAVHRISAVYKYNKNNKGVV